MTPYYTQCKLTPLQKRIIVCSIFGLNSNEIKKMVQASSDYILRIKRRHKTYINNERIRRVKSVMEQLESASVFER
ncbi:hypothetical protein ACHELW_000755 [Vibrio vulnificus]